MEEGGPGSFLRHLEKNGQQRIKIWAESPSAIKKNTSGGRIIQGAGLLRERRRIKKYNIVMGPTKGLTTAEKEKKVR